MSDEQTPFARLFPPLPQGFNEPFWYGSLQSFWLYYRVDPELAAGKLPALHACFTEHTLRLFGRHGIKPVGFWTTYVGPSSTTRSVAVVAVAVIEGRVAPGIRYTGARWPPAGGSRSTWAAHAQTALSSATIVPSISARRSRRHRTSPAASWTPSR